MVKPKASSMSRAVCEGVNHPGNAVVDPLLADATKHAYRNVLGHPDPLADVAHACVVTVRDSRGAVSVGDDSSRGPAEGHVGVPAG